VSQVQPKPIAIIGLSILLPGADDDLDRLDELLLGRVDLVGPPSAHRKDDLSVPPETELTDCALLDRIDLFDHDFFGLSLREAQQMDPQQRALLELSCRAIWDAGYSIEAMRGRRIATIFGASTEHYSRLFPTNEPGLVTGLLPAAQAGRIAHLLDLRGPALTVDTACSSSLFAVQDAVARLQTGTIDLALAGGVRLMCALPVKNSPASHGIVSPNGRARSFDALADGTGLGEGGAVFLLKPLEAAVADGDIIRAVIKSGAANQDGGQSNGFTAPSAVAQEELIVEAWRKSGIDPSSLGMIEAHGTGTRLGDPIEFEALSKAFARFGVPKKTCVLSSIKSNIGHLDSAAGAAGLAKLVTALSTGNRYASAHFNAPNTLLDTENSALLLSTDAQFWSDQQPLRAGISAFGLTGTNVHLVVESAPKPTARSTESSAHGPLIIPLAARSEIGLRSQALRLSAFLQQHSEEPHTLLDLAYTQACGRDHDRWRACIIADSSDHAASALAELGAGKGDVAFVPDQTSPILVFPHEDMKTDMCDWATAFPKVTEWLETPEANDWPDGLACRLAAARLLIEAGLPEKLLIGSGNGNAVVDMVQANMEISAASAAATAECSPIDSDQVGRLIAKVAANGDPVLLVAWRGELADIAENHLTDFDGKRIDLNVGLPPREALLEMVASAYQAGVAIDWAKTTLLLGADGRRASIPVDIFARTRCWIENPRVWKPNDEPAISASTHIDSWLRDDALAEDEGTPAELTLARIWCEVLGSDKVSREDDFFDLGGNSLMQTQLDNRILADFGVKMAVDAIYDFATLREMASHLETLAPPAPVPTETPSYVPRREKCPASHAQRRMWVLQQLDSASGAYNVAATFRVDGIVDSIRMQHALDSVAARHDILRTTLVMEEGTLVQQIGSASSFDLKIAQVDDFEAATILLIDHSGQPFDLEVSAARALLIGDEGKPGAWFQLVLHHAVCDEWSMNLLLSELAAAYDTQTALEAPSLQFTDWATWELEHGASPEFIADAQYWKDQFDDLPSPLDLPTDFPRSAQCGYDGLWLEVAIAPELVRQMRSDARQRQGTLFTWLLTSYAAWLSGLCQTDDFIVGVPVAGRYSTAAEQMLGCFINTLPLRIEAAGSPTFAQLFEKVRRSLNNAIEHQRYPFDRIVEQSGAVGHTSGPPLVQTLLSLQGSKSNSARTLSGSPMLAIELPGRTAWFDLSVVFRETPEGGLAGILAYRSALFEQVTVAAFWRDWLTIIETALSKPEEHIFSLISEDVW
jgi:3-oxoacyl-(acyl-carrier-protein) synthase/acyl carrier protein